MWVVGGGGELRRPSRPGRPGPSLRPGGRREAAGRPSGGRREAAGRQPGGSWEASGKPPGGLREASGRPPGGLREASGRGEKLQNKSVKNGLFYRGLEGGKIAGRAGSGRVGSGRKREFVADLLPNAPRKNTSFRGTPHSDIYQFVFTYQKCVLCHFLSRKSE